jgi:very-short-patch-repair endonuclease
MVYLGRTIEKEMHLGAKPELFKYAQEMRKNPTESEEALWKVIKKIRSEGFIFRRQHPIDIFIADFYCHKLKLIIEAEGEIHLNDQTQEYDVGRTGELEKYGIKVLRFTNDQVINNVDLVIKQIREYIDEIAWGCLKSRNPLTLPTGRQAQRSQRPYAKIAKNSLIMF